MHETTRVAVLATHLAQTDRRALSQAWYSALHLTERAPRPHKSAAARTPFASALIAPRASRAASEAAPLRAATGAASRVAGRDASPRRGANACEPERRTAKTVLTGRLEHALARRVARGVPASFTVRAAGGRIHLVVRSDGAHTRVVAVCAPPLREGVERALAHARFALAGAGVRVEAA